MLRKCYGDVTGSKYLRSVIRLGPAATLILALANFAASQTIPASSPGPDHAAVGSPDKTTAQSIKRWFEIDTLTFSPRYRYMRNASDVTIGSAAQYQFNGRAHFKFDKEGKYAIHMGLFSGNNITGGWNNLGPGTGDAQTTLYLKQLYFRAKPVDGLEIQAGGVGVNNGVGTEVTGYDVDAYMTGERVTVRAPQKAWFDEISVVNGYLGDPTNPNVFDRFKHLNKSNYHQFLVSKKLNNNISFSADYTFEAGKDHLRQAVRFKVPWRANLLDPGYGLNIYGEKPIHKKFVVGAGFARIDAAMYNADRFPPGNRFYTSATWTLSREFSINSFFIQGIGDLPSTATRTRWDMSLTFNILEALRRYELH